MATVGGRGDETHSIDYVYAGNDADLKGEQMSKSYIFKVKELKEIDNYRISKENPESKFLLVGKTGKTGIPKQHLLLILNSFVEQFSKDDNQTVADMPLCKDWGWGCINHRSWYIYSKDIPKIISELRKAEKYLSDGKVERKKITVKVTELDISEGNQRDKTNDCKNCGKPIHYEEKQKVWVHDHGLCKCRTGKDNKYAQPKDDPTKHKSIFDSELPF